MFIQRPLFHGIVVNVVYFWPVPVVSDVPLDHVTGAEVVEAAVAIRVEVRLDEHRFEDSSRLGIYRKLYFV